jgi:hypothetical protein
MEELSAFTTLASRFVVMQLEIDTVLDDVKQVDQGLIPADPPPTFVREDWEPVLRGCRLGSGRDWTPPSQRTRRILWWALADTQSCTTRTRTTPRRGP